MGNVPVIGAIKASLTLGLVFLVGCKSAPPPAAVPPARRQAQFRAESAVKLSRAQNWSAAAREWHGVADEFAALNDLGNEAVALHNQAQAERELGQTRAAKGLLERATALNQETGQTNEWWRNQLALLQLESEAQNTNELKGRFALLAPLVPALSLVELRGLYFNELGQWRQRQGEFSAATNSYAQAERAFRFVGLGEGVAAVLANRAQLLLAQTNYAAALSEWTRALAAYEALAEPLGITRALAAQARTLWAANQRFSDVEKYLRRAAQNYRTLRRPTDQAQVLAWLVECLQSQHKPTESAQEELAQVREALAVALERAGDRAAARQHWQAAADLWALLQQPAARDRAVRGVQRCTQP